MDGNGYGYGEPGEREDAAGEPLPRRAPGHGQPFSPLRFESEPDPGDGYAGSGYADAGYSAEGYSGEGYTGGGYGGSGYGGGGYGGSGYQPPPGPYPSQVPLGPYSSQPAAAGPFTSEFDLRPYVGGRPGEPTGAFARAAPVTRHGYEPGEPTYGDTLYARTRYGEADVEVRPGLGGRHARSDRGLPPQERPTTRRRSAPPPSTKDGAEGERRHMPLWQELPLLLVVAFCLAVLIRSFLLQAFFIPSSSMEQTLLIGDRVLVNKVIYDLRGPERGEIVVFRGTDKWAPENFVEPTNGVMSRIGRTLGDLVGVSRPGEKDFIKRVIGLPGDRVACCDEQGRVTVNGVGIDEPYIDVNSSLEVPPSPGVCGSRRFEEVLIPDGQVFVMGDNRIVSQDARCQGPVPIKNIIGKAFVVVWPSSRWTTLTVPDTFDAVPAPAALGPAPPPALSGGATVGAAVVTLPILATLVGSARGGLRRHGRPRKLPR